MDTNLIRRYSSDPNGFPENVTALIVLNLSACYEQKEDLPSNSSNSLYLFSGTTLIFLIFFMSVMICVIVVGNMMVILAFLVDKRIRSNSNYFLLNLAIGDFFVGSFSIPLYIPYVLTGKWMLGRVVCKMWLVMDTSSCAASTLNIIVISYDRFLSVTKAVEYRAQQAKTSKAARKMVAVWVTVFLFYGSLIVGWEHVVGKTTVPEEACYYEFNNYWDFLLGLSLCSFGIPVMCVTYLNASIFWSIKKSNRSTVSNGLEIASQINSSDGRQQLVSISSLETENSSREKRLPVQSVKSEISIKRRKTLWGIFNFKMRARPSAKIKTSSVSHNHSQSRQSRDVKIAKSLAVIVCIFGMCWAPYSVVMIIYAACHDQCIEKYWYEIAFWLLWFNSFINPFLYPLCHGSFRRAFKKFVCFTKK